MPFPSTPEELQRALSKKLRATRECATDPWRDEQEVFDVTLGVASFYRNDDTQPRRLWGVQPQVLRPKVPGAPLKVFAVLRSDGHAPLQASEVYPRDFEPHASNTEAKAQAIAAALNALEEEAERGDEPEDVSQ
jgi:hypothetical protein